MQKIIDINFAANETHLSELQDRFNDIGQEALYMDHYELSNITGISPLDWREFITDNRVIHFIDGELELIKRSKIIAMLKDIEKNRSTGQAQLLNTLLNQTKNSNVKEGPIYIYSYIPPNAQERNSGRVEVLNVDPFKINNR